MCSAFVISISVRPYIYCAFLLLLFFANQTTSTKNKKIRRKWNKRDDVDQSLQLHNKNSLKCIFVVFLKCSSNDWCNIKTIIWNEAATKNDLDWNGCINVRKWWTPQKDQNRSKINFPVIYVHSVYMPTCNHFISHYF